MATVITQMKAISTLDKLRRIALPVTILDSLEIKAGDPINLELRDGLLIISKRDAVSPDS